MIWQKNSTVFRRQQKFAYPENLEDQVRCLKKNCTMNIFHGKKFQLKYIFKCLWEKCYRIKYFIIPKPTLYDTCSNATVRVSRHVKTPLMSNLKASIYCSVPITTVPITTKKQANLRLQWFFIEIIVGEFAGDCTRKEKLASNKCFKCNTRP